MSRKFLEEVIRLAPLDADFQTKLKGLWMGEAPPLKPEEKERARDRFPLCVLMTEDFDEDGDTSDTKIVESRISVIGAAIESEKSVEAMEYVVGLILSLFKSRSYVMGSSEALILVERVGGQLVSKEKMADGDLWVSIGNVVVTTERA